MQENHKKMSCPLPGHPGGGQLIFLWCKAGECERGMRATGGGVYSDAFAGLPDGLWRSPIDMGTWRELSETGSLYCQPVRSDAIMTLKRERDTVDIRLVQKKNGDDYGYRFDKAVCDAPAL